MYGDAGDVGDAEEGGSEGVCAGTPAGAGEGEREDEAEDDWPLGESEWDAGLIVSCRVQDR